MRKKIEEHIYAEAIERAQLINELPHVAIRKDAKYTFWLRYNSSKNTIQVGYEDSDGNPLVAKDGTVLRAVVPYGSLLDALRELMVAYKADIGRRIGKKK